MEDANGGLECFTSEDEAERDVTTGIKQRLEHSDHHLHPLFTLFLKETATPFFLVFLL